MYMLITFLAHRWRKFTTLFHKVSLNGVCGCVCLILSHDLDWTPTHSSHKMNHISEGQALHIYVEIYPMIVIRSLNTHLPHARDLRIVDRTGKTGVWGCNDGHQTCKKHRSKTFFLGWPSKYILCSLTVCSAKFSHLLLALILAFCLFSK